MGLIHLYNSIDNTHETITGNGKLLDLLPDVDFSKSIVIREGFRLNPEETEINENDILYIRQTPGSTTVIATIAIVSSVVAVGVGIGVGLYANKMSEEAKAKMEKAQRDAENLANSIESLPFLKGASNKSALGNPIQYLIGEMYNAPYKLTDGYYSIGGKNGSKQYWTVVLCCGFGKQLIKSINAGTSRIKTFTDAEPQNGIYKFDEDSPYYDEENTIEIIQNANLTASPFSRKVISVQDGSQVKHEFGEESEPVIKQMATNTKELEVCIQFNGLRRYNEQTSAWEKRLLTVVPSWSNDNGATWHNTLNDPTETFAFNFPSESTWKTCSKTEIDNAIARGEITLFENGVFTFWQILTDNYKFVGEVNDKFIIARDGVIPEVIKFAPEESTNKIYMNSRNTMRFIATREFTWDETHDADGNELDLLFRVEKIEPNLESNSNEDVYLLYYNSFCYDAMKSSKENGLVDCVPLEMRFTEKCTLMGIRLIANESTTDTLDEINAITAGIARTWDKDTKTWSTEKTTTRNPAAWLLEVATSDIHPHSKYADDELDLLSFGELYEYCEENEFYSDALLTNTIKKQDIFSGILKSVNADMIIDNFTGKRKIVIDKKEDVPVALLNAQCVRSVTTAKSFERKPNGMKVNFTNRKSWAIDTFYSMLDGASDYDVDDTITELSIDYVTTHNHAYKMAQRLMRQSKLQPREIRVKIGKEGDFYPLYSTVKLQLEQLKIGLNSAVIHSVKIANNKIEALTISDAVYFEDGKRYGIVIQCENENGHALLNAEVIGEGRTNYIEFVEPISLNDIEIIPSIYNVLSFGELNDDGSFEKITNVMKITAISGDDSGIELTLKDYNEAIYEYGVIPEYKSNLTSTPNTNPSKVNELNYIDYTRGLKEQIIQEATATITPIKQIVDITNADGYPEGSLGIYENKFYQVRSGKWIALDSDNYLGISATVPQDAGMGAFFVAKYTISDVAQLIVGSGKRIAVNHDGVLVPICAVKKFNVNTIYERTENGWKEITNKNDYRYIIAMNDIIANGGELPFVIEEKLAEVVPEYTPHYLGASTTPPQAHIGDWFTYTGEDSGIFKKAIVYTYNGENWEIDNNKDHKIGALDDLLDVTVMAGEGYFANAFIDKLVTNEAFIEKLVAKYVELKDGGYIKSSNYDATNPDTKGIYIDTDGNATLRGNVKINGTTEMENALLKKSVSMISFNANADVNTINVTSSFEQIEELFNKLGNHIPFDNNKRSSINANFSVFVGIKGTSDPSKWIQASIKTSIIRVDYNPEYQFYRIFTEGINVCHNTTSGETGLIGDFSLEYKPNDYISFKSTFNNYGPYGTLHHDGTVTGNVTDLSLTVQIAF